MEELREATADFLRRRGVDAVTAWDSAPEARRKNALAVVSLRGCQGGPAGLRDYLGERYDPESGQWVELYGKRAVITLGLDLYAPERQGERGCAELFTRLSEALSGGGPEGLAVRELSCGETAYDREQGMFRCSARAVCQVYLYAQAAQSGEFTDFRVRGTKQ